MALPNPFAYSVSDRTKLTSPSFGRAVMPTSSVGNYVNQQLARVNNAQSGRVQQGTPALQRLEMQQASPQSVAVDLGPTGESGRRLQSSMKSSNDRVLASLQLAQKRRQAKQAANTGSGPAGPAAGPTGSVRATSGPTVNRIQSLLRSFPGLRITEVGGNREYDVANGVARVPNSYHYDRQNPAVDIGGSTAQLDALYQELLRQGGWRQILWRVPGHYDHIHVA